MGLNKKKADMGHGRCGPPAGAEMEGTCNYAEASGTFKAEKKVKK